MMRLSTFNLEEVDAWRMSRSLLLALSLISSSETMHCSIFLQVFAAAQPVEVIFQHGLHLSVFFSFQIILVCRAIAQQSRDLQQLLMFSMPPTLACPRPR